MPLLAIIWKCVHKLVGRESNRDALVHLLVGHGRRRRLPPNPFTASPIPRYLQSSLRPLTSDLRLPISGSASHQKRGPQSVNLFSRHPDLANISFYATIVLIQKRQRPSHGFRQATEHIHR